MYYTDIKHYKPSHFKRLVGVTRSAFEAMVVFIIDYKQATRKFITKGRLCKLCEADQVLMMLMYYREYRTFFHVGASYGLSETQCWRVVTQTESLLLQNKAFHLPGKKALHKAENNFEIIVVDVSEHPVERPKKNSEKVIQAKTNGIPKKAR
jgi:Helix-turn-helix of DDE superfamily endonuclease